MKIKYIDPATCEVHLDFYLLCLYDVSKDIISGMYASVKEHALDYDTTTCTIHITTNTHKSGSRIVTCKFLASELLSPNDSLAVDVYLRIFRCFIGEE